MFPATANEETAESSVNVHVEPSATLTVALPIELITPFNSVFFRVQFRELIESTIKLPLSSNSFASMDVLVELKVLKL